MAELEKRWEKYAKKHLVGKKVSQVRYLSKKECDGMGWDAKALVIQFDDGTIVFPSSDDEGNNAGALFGQTDKGELLTFPVI